MKERLHFQGKNKYLSGSLPEFFLLYRERCWPYIPDGTKRMSDWERSGANEEQHLSAVLSHTLRDVVVLFQS